ncbi:hypothetical protein [Noviherbaspirillum saxi]|uniref:hypothetical protein n=1 Tax=Noviherbaspirillum saxi TaxID=2320863 RepID=UPI0013146802|nr:hypothetical protein [Noviherbaspirillum saxi]
MSCPDGANFQCSGTNVLSTNNGITVTNSGVQVHGISTSDLANPILVKTTASGFAPASGGFAEARIAKDANSNMSTPIIVLSNLGLTWDGKVDRPPIIETFSISQGRTVLTATGAMTSTTLPPPSDLNYYNFGRLGPAATQANYANNRYFPRTGNPSRCGPDVNPCPATETSGPRVEAGNWRSGGTTPDSLTAIRVHEDGDIHAGNGPNDANGNPTILEGGSGIGVPFPGSKGYRGFDNWGLQYSNLGAWITQDTVVIAEWAPQLGNEHNKNRRGMIAYGAVTNPTLVPTSGTVTYTGFSYGMYAPNRASDPSVFRGASTVTVNFATRQVTISVQNAVTDDSAGTAVPVNFTSTTTMGAAGSSLANHMTGTASVGGLSGGVGGRYFGPVAGGGPAEVGGTFQLSNAGTGQFAIGGFLGRKQ